ncbi:MAG: hypothetical protein V1707_01390 [bacterium]
MSKKRPFSSPLDELKAIEFKQNGLEKIVLHLSTVSGRILPTEINLEMDRETMYVFIQGIADHCIRCGWAWQLALRPGEPIKKGVIYGFETSLSDLGWDHPSKFLVYLLHVKCLSNFASLINCIDMYALNTNAQAYDMKLVVNALQQFMDVLDELKECASNHPTDENTRMLEIALSTVTEDVNSLIEALS